MIVFVVYAAAIWLGVYMLRRRWESAIVLAVGMLPLFFMTAGASVTFSGHEYNLSGWLKSLGMFGGVLHIVSGMFSVVVLLGGILIAVQRPGPGAYQCQKCLYDLRENETGVCPECGASLEVGAPAVLDGANKRG